jgi:hypothetical protein
MNGTRGRNELTQGKDCPHSGDFIDYDMHVVTGLKCRYEFDRFVGQFCYNI